MQISTALDRRDGAARSDWTAFCWMGKSHARALGLLLSGYLHLHGRSDAQDGPLVLERNGRTIAIEPYAPNIFGYR